MKIKEAAALCGLTEKAIRLYESRGLIVPETEEKNGRIYREYGEDSIRMLKTIAVLRRADFSIEQIGEMKASPEKIPEIFQAYRERIHADCGKLLILREASEKMVLGDDTDINGFADRFAALMEEAENPGSGELSDAESDSWDEEVTGIAAVWMMVPPKVRKAIVICVPALLIALFLLHSLCLTTPVTFTEEGVLYHRENGEVTPVTLTMDGKMKRWVWNEDYYTGEISFSGFRIYDSVRRQYLTDDGTERLFNRMKLYYEEFFTRIDVGERTSFIHYPFRNSDRLKLDHHTLVIRGLEGNEDFSLVWAVDEPVKGDSSRHHWQSDTGYYLVFPAKTQDDAEFLVRRMWDLYNEEFSPEMPIDE